MIGALRLLFSSKRKFYKQLVRILGFCPTKWEIYELAFIHRSASLFLKDGSTVNNERLEFLGDAVLDCVVAEFLFNYYPNKDEGFLSQMRSKIVKRNHMNQLAKKVGIDHFIIANSLSNTFGKNVFGNALEALIGAIYLDRGYNQTRKFIHKMLFANHINMRNIEVIETDFKSRLIEWSQKNRQEITFDCQEENESNTKAPVFIAKIWVANILMGEGKGFSKKEAEQNAAEQAFWAVNERL